MIRNLFQKKAFAMLLDVCAYYFAAGSVRRAGLALADALDLWRVEGIELVIRAGAALANGSARRA